MAWIDGLLGNAIPNTLDRNGVQNCLPGLACQHVSTPPFLKRRIHKYQDLKGNILKWSNATRFCCLHTFPFPFQDEAQVITWIMNMIMIAVFKMASMNTTPDRPERKMGNQQVTWNHFP